MAWWNPASWAADGAGYIKDVVEKDPNEENRKNAERFMNPGKSNFEMPGAKERANGLLRNASWAQRRTAPQAQDSAFRAQQAALGDMLMRQAQGQDSLAALQLREATDRGIAQQQAMAASARPGQGAMAARMASQNAGRMNQGYAGQAQQTMLAERLGATNALGSMLQGARGQDLQLGQFNTSAKLQNQAQGDALYQALRDMELRNALAQQQGSMGYEDARTSRFASLYGQPHQVTNLDRALGLMSGLGKTAMAAGGGGA